ncbi:sigma-70 family RNA polymerase sigma factor [Acinetobacter puyangensis]|uniref:sigma-70 family RNA polymerase sigma factor n=1 Tax=Acinetobacter puyangensis TaxID=1096779 RepID=UPI003A4DD9CC
MDMQQKHIWFSQIYQSHHSTLLRWFNSKLNHQQQAEDLSHEVFYRILKSEYQQDIKEPKAWLLGIAKHIVIDHWRKQHIERLYLDALRYIPEDYHPSAEHEACIRESIYQVHFILEQLPARVAQTFLLARLDGLNYVQIAEQLNISETTVKRDMKQAFLACMQIDPLD